MTDSKLQILYNAIDQLEELDIPVSNEQRIAIRNEERRHISEEIIPVIEEEIKGLTKYLRCPFKIVIENDDEGQLSVRQIIEAVKSEDGKTYGDRKKKFILRVIFRDGSSVCQQKVSETLAEVVRRVGVNKVKSLNLQVLGHDFISSELHQNDRYRSAQLEVSEGLYVMTYCDSEAKMRIIKEISNSLNLGLKVEKVML